MSIHCRWFFFKRSSYLWNIFLKVNSSRSKYLNPSGHCSFLSVLYEQIIFQPLQHGRRIWAWNKFTALCLPFKSLPTRFETQDEIIACWNHAFSASKRLSFWPLKLERLAQPSLDCEDHNLFERFSQSVAFIPKWIYSEIRSSFQWHLTNCLLFSESLSKRQPFENNLLSQEAFHISFSIARSFRLIVKSVTPLSLSLSPAQAYVLIQNVFLRLRDAQAVQWIVICQRFPNPDA